MARRIHILTPDIFDDVIKLVKSGLTIKESLIKMKFDSRAFYKLISTEQRLLLHQAKTSIVIGGQTTLDSRNNYKEAFPANFEYCMEGEDE